MTRKEQIIEQAKHEDSDGYFGFISGAEWADENPIELSAYYEELRGQLKERGEKIKKLAIAVVIAVEALEFYGNQKYAWFSGGMEGDGEAYSADMGNKARETLQKLKSNIACNSVDTIVK